MASGVGGNQPGGYRPLSFQENMQQIQKIVKILEEAKAIIRQSNSLPGSGFFGKPLKERVTTEATKAQALVKLIPPDFDTAEACLVIARRSLSSLKTECR